MLFSQIAASLIVMFVVCVTFVEADEPRPKPTSNSLVADSADKDSVDGVTEQLFRQYVLGRGKIPTSNVQAAIVLVAARGNGPAFNQIVLNEFEKTYKDENASTVRRNLLQLMAKMFAREGSDRWRYEHARRTGQAESSATTVTPTPSPEYEKIVYRESKMLERLIVRGRQANRHEIDAFVIAVRQAHHPQGKSFLLDVLQNSPDPEKGKWLDNTGGSWRDAQFHAAVGLAELGDHAGVEWLIKQSEPNDFGTGSMSVSLSNALHAKASGGNLRQSCVCALEDLSGLQAVDDAGQWKTWWGTSKERFVPRAVALRIE